jgi:hypothetical protein
MREIARLARKLLACGSDPSKKGDGASYLFVSVVGSTGLPTSL